MFLNNFTALFRVLMELQSRLVNGLKLQCKDDFVSGKELLPSILLQIVMLNCAFLTLLIWISKNGGDNFLLQYLQVNKRNWTIPTLLCLSFVHSDLAILLKIIFVIRNFFVFLTYYL
jgi:hypothetical protein